MDSNVKRMLENYLESIQVNDRIQEVVDIFKQCFGESNIDVVPETMADAWEYYQYDVNSIIYYADNESRTLEKIKNAIPYIYIIVKFDHETITNEIGQSTNIYDFFVRIPLKENGCLLKSFEYKKATFTVNQFYSGYVHSHTPRVMKSRDGIKHWGGVCLGSGPMNHTIAVLMSPHVLETWYGFIAELRQVIRHESLEGGPYIKISSITGPTKEIKTFSRASLTKKEISLAKSYIRAGRMKFGFVGGRFYCGVPFVEWLIDFTEYAKEWYKQNYPFTNCPLEDVYISGNKIFDIVDNNQNETSLEGRPVITFKGQQYNLKILKDSEIQARKLLNPRKVATILKKILETLNYWYANSEYKTADASTAMPIFK